MLDEIKSESFLRVRRITSLEMENTHLKNGKVRPDHGEREMFHRDDRDQDRDHDRRDHEDRPWDRDCAPSSPAPLQKTGGDYVKEK